MSFRWFIYYCALCGGCAAYLGWALGKFAHVEEYRTVEAGVKDSWAYVSVADEGPGIPLGAGERGRSDRGSTGLGLDIARRCAEAAGGRLTIHPNLPTGSSIHLTLAAPGG